MLTVVPLLLAVGAGLVAGVFFAFSTFVMKALAQLPARERRIVGLYYFGEATMKQIGDAIGVNESRVSQLHARALDRLKRLLAADMGVHESANEAAAEPRMRMVKMSKMGVPRASAASHAPAAEGRVA